MRQKVFGTLVAGLAIAFLARSASAATPSAFAAIVADFYAAQDRAHPAVATALGIHDGDQQLDDISAAAVESERLLDHKTLDAVTALDPSTLAPMERDDRDVLIGQLKGAILRIETIRSWQTDPEPYVDLAVGSIYSLIERDFAPASDRLRAVIAREKLIPHMLEQAQSVLKDVPPEYITITLENAEGGVEFLNDAPPKAFEGVADPALQHDLKTTTASAKAALAAYGAFVKKLAPTATAKFAWGSDTLTKYLADIEMIDLPPDRLLALAWAHLRDEQAAFAKAATAVSPGKPVAAAVDHIMHDHPSATELIPTARNQLADLRAFIVQKKLLTIPAGVSPVVEETPSFQRALISAEFDPPGPYETKAKNSFYFVTPPDLTQKPAEVEAYLQAYSRPRLLITSAHEVWPGHFMQYLAQTAHPEWSPVRLRANAEATTEGWAHYVEQMMVEAGLDATDPEVHLGQILEAFLRDCRMVASLEMHTNGMSVADAAKLFQRECYSPAPEARREAYRGTQEPDYLAYTTGKLMILKLRSDVQKQRGDAFSLGAFHDEFLSKGLVPVPIIRREMTGTDGPSL